MRLIPYKIREMMLEYEDANEAYSSRVVSIDVSYCEGLAFRWVPVSADRISYPRI